MPVTAIASHGDVFDVISLEMKDTGHTVWRITSPNVLQKTTAYPGISVAPGDSVQVFAGGCVQTGGSGLTWKRYVNPSGDNADHLYHGLIDIPGITKGLVRIQQFGLDTPHAVSVPATLTLGYEDDGYDDNGYWGHDNGTQSQCQDTFNAFILVAITHPGATPIVASAFQDILPSEFLQRAGWAFDNEGTPTLSWTTFRNAFDLGPADYVDFVTYIVFAAARGHLAAGGDCMGMALLADMAENQWVVGPIAEDIGKNYPYTSWSAAPSFILDAIRTMHWEQLSVAFLHNYLANVIHSPADNAQMIANDLAKPNFTYGLISIAHGTTGHVLVPLKVRTATQNGKAVTLIDVYDPDRPYPTAGAAITVDGSHWSFQMNGGELWSGSTANNGLAYVPYDGSSGWRKLGVNVSGLVQLIFGSADVQQMTDSKGRKLFNPDGSIDASATGLGTAVFRLPYYGQAVPLHPRNGQAPLRLTNDVPEPPWAPATLAEYERDYAEDYAQGSNIFLVDPGKVADLTVETLAHQTRAQSAAQPVRMLINQSNAFFEVKAATAAAASAASPDQRISLTIHQLAALSEGGITVRSLDARPASTIPTSAITSAVITAGTRAAANITIQRTDPLPIAAGIRVQNPANNLRISSIATIAPIRVTPRVLDQGSSRDLQPRQLTIQPATGN